MVDIETTHIRADYGAVIQIAAVKFDIDTQQVSDQVFDRCLRIPPDRFWSEGTRNWWFHPERQQLLRSIISRGEDPATVMQDFARFCVVDDGRQPRFWGKPSHFDYPYIDSYFTKYGIHNPFSYREVMDMNSYLRGIYAPDPVPEVDMEFRGEAHNALHDAIHQLRILFHHVTRTGNRIIEGEVLPPETAGGPAPWEEVQGSAT